MARTIAVFVYGTLMKNHGNHALLRNAKYEGASTVTGVQVYDLGPFPAAIMTGSPDDVVHGETYLVNEKEFASLDRLEGFPSFYYRSLVETSVIDTAWIYHFKSAHEIRERGTLIESGKWTSQYARV